MNIGEQRRTIYVEPIEEPLEEPVGDPSREDHPSPNEPAKPPSLNQADDPYYR